MTRAGTMKGASAKASPHRFRPLQADDLTLLAHCRAAPHVAEWWDDAAEVEEIAEDDVAKWIVEMNGRPFAFA